LLRYKEATRYVDDAEPMKSVIVIEAGAGIDRW